MNVITIIGRLTKDAPEARVLDDGSLVVRVTVASSKKAKDKEQSKTLFIPVDLFLKSDRVIPYLKKGKAVAVYDASLKTGQYVDKEGKKRNSFAVQANRIQLLPDGAMEDSTNVDIIGRLTKDAVVAHVPNGTADPFTVAEFTLAVDRGDSADFIDAVLYGPIVNKLGRYLIKGKLVNLKGRLVSSDYERKDGTTATRWKLMVDKVSLLGGATQAPKKQDDSMKGYEDVETATGELNDNPVTESSARHVSLPSEFDAEYFDEEYVPF